MTEPVRVWGRWHPVHRVGAWLREHAPTVAVALVMSYLAFIFSPLPHNVDQNRTRIDATACLAVGSVLDALEGVINDSRQVNVPPGITDPQLLSAYDQAKADAEDRFGQYAARLDIAERTLKRLGCSRAPFALTTTTTTTTPGGSP